MSDVPYISKGGSDSHIRRPVFFRKWYPINSQAIRQMSCQNDHGLSIGIGIGFKTLVGR